ncbi:ABC-type phosphate transport system permease component [Synechococcus sp. BIOS-U3-1]|uniref:phosphate ABC transporter permease PstA n=1 Tax=Synechococcus sp. BIOS-U3-1 TaxID=1400865 RepID=UPI000C460418|nr:phosphate ABC transporter permease PstA [Synechococcus sp. BIOS-U3-1]MAD68901.1 phosphate ABC transporter, permease protein PstA [Synechococcus sp. CPC100]QNI58449.1 ABC-type phosphate transport system permease component [Synechococcus sp. BIOS-U3-1]|tara:strand:+ start:2294 stop:3199 length:906 start_codon:yes stop_codon:yes gene_type:complete
MTFSSTALPALDIPDLSYKQGLRRNVINRILTILAGLFAVIAVLPLIAVLAYVLVKGGGMLNLSLFNEPSTGLPGEGIGNAVIGTLLVTLISALIAIPVGVGGGIFLAEYSRGGSFAQFIRFGTNVMSGVPSIIAGVFIYIAIVETKIIFGNSHSALAGGIALSILMLPTVIKTTDEGLKLVSDDLRRAALGVGASRFVTILRITLPSAFTPIATGVVLSIARAAGETAPLIFTALFSSYWPQGINSIFNPIATLSVLIYNYARLPYPAQNELAWAASFVLVLFILIINLFARWLGRFAAN